MDCAQCTKTNTSTRGRVCFYDVSSKSKKFFFAQHCTLTSRIKNDLVFYDEKFITVSFFFFTSSFYVTYILVRVQCRAIETTEVRQKLVLNSPNFHLSLFQIVVIERRGKSPFGFDIFQFNISLTRKHRLVICSN